MAIKGTNGKAVRFYVCRREAPKPRPKRKQFPISRSSNRRTRQKPVVAELRQDLMTGTLGRSAPGKFVETVVQVLQWLDTGQFEPQPSVDDYLRNVESRAPGLDDGLRLCAARIARAMYTLRNKRSIAHKGDIDPNTYDLRFLMHAAQWIMAEVIRQTAGLSMEEAGRLIDVTQLPVDELVEDFGGRKLVLPDLPLKDEVLLVLHSFYPESMLVREVEASLDRRNPGTVRRTIRQLWKEKLAQGGGAAGYRLTMRGYRAAVAVIQRHSTS